MPSLGDFTNPGLNPGLLHCRLTLYPLSHQGSQELCEVLQCKPSTATRDASHNPETLGHRMAPAFGEDGGMAPGRSTGLWAGEGALHTPRTSRAWAGWAWERAPRAVFHSSQQEDSAVSKCISSLPRVASVNTALAGKAPAEPGTSTVTSSLPRGSLGAGGKGRESRDTYPGPSLGIVCTGAGPSNRPTPAPLSAVKTDVSL